jgi:hypothetical protein
MSQLKREAQLERQRPKWTLDWLRERVRQQHSNVLRQYLLNRDAAVAADHLAAHYDTNRIIREGFCVDTGHTSVPQDAMACLRKLPDVDPFVVWNIVKMSKDRRQPCEFGNLLLKLCKKRPGFRDTYRDLVHEVHDLIIVYEIMEC